MLSRVTVTMRLPVSDARHPRRRLRARPALADDAAAGPGRCPRRPGPGADPPRRPARALAGRRSTRSPACFRPSWPPTPSTARPGSASSAYRVDRPPRPRAAAAARALVVPAARGLHVRHGRRPARALALLARDAASSSLVEAAKRTHRLPGLPRADRRRRAPGVVRGDARRARVRRPLRRPRGGVHAGARDARALPDRALRALHRRRRPALPRRAPPPALAAAARRATVEAATLAPLPLEGEPSPSLRRRAGRARLAAGGADEPAAPDGARLGRRRGALVVLKLTSASRRTASGLVSEAVALRDRPRRGAAHLLRARRRGPAGRRLAPVRAREGGASRRAGRGIVPRARSLLIGGPGARAAHRAAPRRRARALVRVRDDRDRDRVDASRASLSWRIARRTSSAALASNALHFASDLAGSVAVLAGCCSSGRGIPTATRRRRSSSPCSSSLACGAADPA